MTAMNEFAVLGQGSIGLGLCQILLFIVSLFLILLVLVQRGKGGGLTGALGGMGGQSAFGTKAGDAFTKITIITTIVWITLCMVTISGFNPPPAAKVTKKMSLMERARELDRSPGIGAPPEEATVPDDMKGDGVSAEESGGMTEDSSDDNVAVKQTPENTRSEEATESESTASEETTAPDMTAPETTASEETDAPEMTVPETSTDAATEETPAQ